MQSRRGSTLLARGGGRLWFREGVSAHFQVCSGGNGIVASKRHYGLVHEKDAKAVEDKFLKHITPEGEDPWEYNKHLLPKVVGVKGDKHVDFGSFKSYNKILDSFMENMVYPHITGYCWTTVPPSQCDDTKLYHWNDDRQFRYPPLVVVPMQGYGVWRRWTEINWGKKLLRCYTELPDQFVRVGDRESRKKEKIAEWATILREARDQGDQAWANAKDKIAKLMHEENALKYGLVEVQIAIQFLCFKPPTLFPQTGYRTDYSEIPIPPNWLLEFKKQLWPASVEFPLDKQKDVPIGYTPSMYRCVCCFFCFAFDPLTLYFFP